MITKEDEGYEIGRRLYDYLAKLWGLPLDGAVLLETPDHIFIKIVSGDNHDEN